MVWDHEAGGSNPPARTKERGSFMKFKKGDIVTCVRKRKYSITDYGVPCIFCGYDDFSDGAYMYVSLESGSTVFTVFSEYFELMKGKSIKVI